MSAKLYLADRRMKVIGVFAVMLCLMGLVFSSSFQTNSLPIQPVKQASSTGIAEIAKPFSYAKSKADAPAPRAVVVAAEALPIPADELSTEPEVLNGDTLRPGSAAAHAWNGTPAGSAFTRPSMLFLRQSLPTYRSLKGAVSQNALAASTAQYLDAPFNSLFASIFKHGNEEGFAAADPTRPKDQIPNPFSEAKQKAEAEAQPPVAATAPPPAKDSPPPSKDTANGDRSANAGASPVTTPKPVARYTVVGDFDGTGVLTALDANRVDNGTFSFHDGQRTFSLSINPAPVELQRSFAVDDFDGDGSADLLVTSRASLFGGVMYGDGNGNFQLGDWFVTGYEPTVPVAGLMRGGQRDILSVNMRTGAVVTFRKQGRYSRILGQGLITFLPDFVARATEAVSGSDRFIAAQAGRSPQVYAWQDDDTLATSNDSLPSDPSITVYKDFLQVGATDCLQVYQVGASASVLLTTGHGQSFNVANLRLLPQIYLVVGDLSNQGTLDVAVAYLLSYPTSK